MNQDKPRGEILRKYELTAPSFDKWVKRINATGSSRDKDNRTPDEQELLRLRKENQQLRKENDILKQAGANIRTKVIVIRANAHKYSISALCRCLGIERSTFYYKCQGRQDESALEEVVQLAYDENRHVYGRRKLKRVLHWRGWVVSRRRIGRIMKNQGMISA